MQRLTAPGFPAGAIADGGNRFELFQSFQPATTGIHIAAEEIAHQGVHRGVLPQRRFPSPLQQGIVNGKREVSLELMVPGSREARAALQALPAESGVALGAEPPLAGQINTGGAASIRASTTAPAN